MTTTMTPVVLMMTTMTYVFLMMTTMTYVSHLMTTMTPLVLTIVPARKEDNLESGGLDFKDKTEHSEYQPVEGERYQVQRYLAN